MTLKEYGVHKGVSYLSDCKYVEYIQLESALLCMHRSSVELSVHYVYHCTEAATHLALLSQISRRLASFAIIKYRLHRANTALQQ
eukprot:12496-Heterococcus_DN1.PRE.2